MPHSSKLLRQGDGEGKWGDGGARGLRKGEGRAGGDQPLGAAGHFDPGKGQSGSPGGENLRKSYPADSGRAGEQNIRPDLKGPKLDRDQKLWGWAPQCQDRRQHPDRYSQAAGGETEAWKDRGCGVT